MEKSIFCYVYILRQFDYNWLYGWDESKASLLLVISYWQIGVWARVIGDLGGIYAFYFEFELLLRYCSYY